MLVARPVNPHHCRIFIRGRLAGLASKSYNSVTLLIGLNPNPWCLSLGGPGENPNTNVCTSIRFLYDSKSTISDSKSTISTPVPVWEDFFYPTGTFAVCFSVVMAVPPSNMSSGPLI